MILVEIKMGGKCSKLTAQEKGIQINLAKFIYFGGVIIS